MKFEEVPGYTELRNKLFGLRYELVKAKEENDYKEKAILEQKIKLVRNEMAKLIYEDKQKKGMKI